MLVPDGVGVGVPHGCSPWPPLFPTSNPPPPSLTLRSIRRVVYGSLAGGVAALLLFSESADGAGTRRQPWVPVALRVQGMHCAASCNAAGCKSSYVTNSIRGCRCAGGPAARTAAVAFGAGFGAGSAYQQTQALVSFPPLFHKRGG